MKIHPFTWFTRKAQKQQQTERLRNLAKAVRLDEPVCPKTGCMGRIK